MPGDSSDLLDLGSALQHTRHQPRADLLDPTAKERRLGKKANFLPIPNLMETWQVEVFEGGDVVAAQHDQDCDAFDRLVVQPS